MTYAYGLHVHKVMRKLALTLFLILASIGNSRGLQHVQHISINHEDTDFSAHWYIEYVEGGTKRSGVSLIPHEKGFEYSGVAEKESVTSKGSNYSVYLSKDEENKEILRFSDVPENWLFLFSSDGTVIAKTEINSYEWDSLTRISKELLKERSVNQSAHTTPASAPR